MGHAVMKKELNDKGLDLIAANTYAGDPNKNTVVKYLVLDKNGDGDGVHYKRLIDALESLVCDRGIGDEIEAMMRESDIDTNDEIQVSDWFHANTTELLALAQAWGYRLERALGWKK